MTNDVHSPIDDILAKGRTLRLAPGEPLPNVPDEVPLIYDFGGYAEPRVVAAAESAKIILVPLIYDSPLEMQVTINTIAEIEAHNRNIVIVVNKAKSTDFEAARDVLRKFYNYPIYEVCQSRGFIRALEQGKSLLELSLENPLSGFHYKKPLRQLNSLIDLIS